MQSHENYEEKLHLMRNIFSISDIEKFVFFFFIYIFLHGSNILVGSS